MLEKIVSLVTYCIVTTINWIIETLGQLIGGIISLLPKSPFADFQSQWFGDIEFIEFFEWIIPIDSIMGLIGSFVFTVLGYYLMKWILSVIKMVN